VRAEGIWLRFLSGPDIESLGISRAEIVDAVADVVTAHGRGQTVFEPRVHLVPDNGGAGHFNVLRGHASRWSVTSLITTGEGCPASWAW
jgi:ornithine cyclodeaminase